MDFFVDTADLDEIKESYSWGIVDGVTTNPSLIKMAVDKLKSSGSTIGIEEYIEEILRTAGGDPVSLEVIGSSEEEMYSQGMTLFERFNGVAENVIVKIPVNPNMEPGSTESCFDGLKAIKRLSANEVPINTTLVFSPEQALLAAKAGASFVSPFAGRVDDDLRKTAGGEFDKTDHYPEQGRPDLDDNGVVSGVELVSQCVDIMEVFGFDCRVLAASLRNPRQVRECALVGSHVATIPFGVLRAMADHHKTVEGMKSFTNDIVPEYAGLFE